MWNIEWVCIIVFFREGGGYFIFEGGLDDFLIFLNLVSFVCIFFIFCVIRVLIECVWIFGGVVLGMVVCMKIFLDVSMFYVCIYIYFFKII